MDEQEKMEEAPKLDGEPPSTWQDTWQWQLTNSITTLQELKKYIPLSLEEIQAVEKINEKKLPFRITPYYLQLIKNSKALRKTVIPSIEEFNTKEAESADPLSEDAQSPICGIIHRYPDRVLLLATTFCSTNCRYCTRSRLIGKEKVFSQASINYIKYHSEIRDVIISGGDPLTLSDDVLDELLSQLRNIPHVEIIRIGTKVPVVLPQRITPELVAILKKYHPLYINIHFTHYDELTEETKRACNLLADAGIPLGSQTVLLKGVNDDAQILARLFKQLLMIRVKPYYLYNCDQIEGTSHFRTTVDKGKEIMKQLRGWISGLAVPYYIIDAPGGGGKIPILPDYEINKSGAILELRNYKDETYFYTEGVA